MPPVGHKPSEKERGEVRATVGFTHRCLRPCPVERQPAQPPNHNTRTVADTAWHHRRGDVPESAAKAPTSHKSHRRRAAPSTPEGRTHPLEAPPPAQNSTSANHQPSHRKNSLIEMTTTLPGSGLVRRNPIVPQATRGPKGRKKGGKRSKDHAPRSKPRCDTRGPNPSVPRAAPTQRPGQ